MNATSIVSALLLRSDNALNRSYWGWDGFADAVSTMVKKFIIIQSFQLRYESSVAEVVCQVLSSKFYCRHTASFPVLIQSSHVLRISSTLLIRSCITGIRTIPKYECQIRHIFQVIETLNWCKAMSHS